MKNQYKILLILALSFLIFTLTFLFILYKGKENIRITDIKDETKSLAAFIVSFRDTYQHAFTDNNIEINEKTLKLLPVTTTPEISKRFSEKIDYNININVVSDRPRNPKNIANKEEMEIISFFKNNPKQKSYFKKFDSLSYYAEPLIITENCMECHGKKEDALKTVQENFDKAYDYEIGDIRGIISVKVSEKPISKLMDRNYKSVVIILLIFYFVFLAINYFLIKTILKKDEDFTKNLEKQVKEKTLKISNLNFRLKEHNEELEASSEELQQNIEELFYKQEIIDETLRKYNLLADNMTDFIWMLDLDLKPQYISPSCKKFTGYSETELKNLNLKYLHPEETISKLMSIKTNILKGNTDFNKHFEIEYIHKEGFLFPAEVYGFVISDYNNKPVGIGGVSRNISEQKKAQTELKKKKEKIEQAHNDTIANIRYAKTIQESLLTSKTIIDKHFNNYFILYKPKDVVSGDFYYVKKHNDYIVFAVADCTGHGVTGGFITMLGITFLHEIAGRKEINEPGTTLNILREKVKDTFKTFGSENPNGMDIALCSINTKTNVLSYAGAYNPLWIIRNKKLIEYKATRNPIGFNYVEIDFTTQKVQLQNNDAIYIFSDGFQDQIGGKREKKYLSKNFKNILLKSSHLPMTEQKTKLEKTFSQWKGNLEQVDDVTIMGIKWKM